MSWQVFLIIAIFGDSLGRITQRFLMRADKSDPIAYAIVSQFLGGVIVGIFALFYGVKIPNLQPILLNLLLLPILWGTASILIFKSLKQTEASLFTILFSTRVIWTVLLAIFLLHEPFSITQFLGTFFIITSIALISYRKAHIKFQKGELLAFAAAGIISLAIINDSIILKSFDAITYSSLSFFLPALFIWLTNLKTTKQIPQIIKSPAMGKILLMMFFYSFGTVGYFLAYSTGRNAAQIASLFQTGSILSVILAILILKERSNLFIKLLAGVLSFIGVLLVK